MWGPHNKRKEYLAGCVGGEIPLALTSSSIVIISLSSLLGDVLSPSFRQIRHLWVVVVVVVVVVAVVVFFASSKQQKCQRLSLLR